ncbi:MAG: hypothetical protein OEO19_13115 [Gammaproteobacteria bacterium]|nr:hypothetical protein [Gammaproteobacteria bacterium]MDH3449445.1 hypothetical protein [Gammaproteobacteria bacterium]
MFWLEALSYVVTILGFPTAILVFVYEQRRRNANEENEIHRQLSAEYDDFLKLVLDNSDLLLLRRAQSPANLSEEQLERRDIIFRMLVSLFEKAYIILYDDNLSGDAKRRWLSWEDDMQDWCRKEDFRNALPAMLVGEDDAFSQHIIAIADNRGAVAG